MTADSIEWKMKDEYEWLINWLTFKLIMILILSGQKRMIKTRKIDLNGNLLTHEKLRFWRSELL